jgi:hypothetical protein
MSRTNSKLKTQAANIALAHVAGVTITAVGLQLSERLTNDAWCVLGIQLGRLAGATQWCLGDWWLDGDDRDECRAVAEQMGVQCATLYNFGSVCRAFEISLRHENLKFSHHQAAMAAMAEQRPRWLDRAEKEGWSVSQLRAEIAEEKAKKKAITESVDTADHGSIGAPSEEDQQEPANDTDPIASAEHRKSEYAAGDAETETATEGEPDQAIEDEAAGTAAKGEEDRKYQRQIEMEKIQADAGNREILINILRDTVESEFLARVTGSDLFKYIPERRRCEVFKDFIEQFTVNDLLAVLTPPFVGRLRTRLATPNKSPKSNKAA